MVKDWCTFIIKKRAEQGVGICFSIITLCFVACASIYQSVEEPHKNAFFI